MKIRRLLSGFLATALVSSTLIFAGCDSEIQSDKVVVTIGNDKIAVKDMKGYLAVSEISAEMTDLMYAQYMAQSGGGLTSTWDSKESIDKFADSTMDTFVEMYIMSKEADKDKDFKKKPTDKDIENFKKNADSMIDSLSDNMKDKTGVTQDDLVEYQKMKFTYDAYRKQLIDGYDIKKDDVKGDFDYDNEYRQYKTTEYSIALTNPSPDGGMTPGTAKSDKEKKEAKETMDKVLDMIKEGKSKDDITKKFESAGLTAQERNFKQSEAYPDKVKKKDDKKDEEAQQDANTKPDKYIEKARELKKGEHSDVIEVEGTSYSIAVMDDNDSKEAYDDAIEGAINTKKEDKYKDKVKELKESDDYKVDISDEWKKLDFGKLIIDRDEFDKAEGKIQDKSQGSDE